jgi:hypothetical protein
MEEKEIMSEIEKGQNERNLENFAEMIAGVVARFYLTLIQAGVPGELAGNLTGGFEEMYVEHMLSLANK